ncbi:hypothetical protein DFH09DRAFT_1070291 [Mycena vulgaris]|nr:hypothetical protein DFH09DRAFT_1070291 [Mycena vulgaris]
MNIAFYSPKASELTWHSDRRTSTIAEVGNRLNRPQIVKVWILKKPGNQPGSKPAAVPASFRTLNLMIPTSCASIFGQPPSLLPPYTPRAMPPSLDAENACPTCGAYLIIKFAAGGQCAGHYYITCHTCKFHFPFPKRDGPPTVDYIPPVNGWYPSAHVERQATKRPRASAAPRRPNTASTTEFNESKARCVETGCGRMAAPSCQYTRCKTHCIINKQGCLAVGHQPERLTARQASRHGAPRERVPNAPTLSLPTPAATPSSSSLRLHSLSPRTLDIISAINPLTTLPPPHLWLDPIEEGLHRDAELEEAQDVAQDEQLRRILMSPAPDTSPVTPEEEANIALAIQASLRPGSATPASTQAASSMAASSSRLRPIYPVGKAPALAGSDVTKTQVQQPKITTQMSASWMRKYRDDTAADAALIKRNQYKSALDLSHGKKFTMVCWNTVRSPSPISCR